jgi:hypothetical protein
MIVKYYRQMDMIFDAAEWGSMSGFGAGDDGLISESLQPFNLFLGEPRHNYLSAQ